MNIPSYQKKLYDECIEKLKNGETLDAGVWIRSMGRYVSKKELNRMTGEIKSDAENSRAKFSGSVIIDDIHK